MRGPTQGKGALRFEPQKRRLADPVEILAPGLTGPGDGAAGEEEVGQGLRQSFHYTILADAGGAYDCDKTPAHAANPGVKRVTSTSRSQI